MEPVSVRYTVGDFRALAWHCRDCRRRLAFFMFLPLLVILFDEFVLSSRAQLDPFMMVGALIFGALLCGVFLFLVPPPQVRAQRKAGFVAPYRISLGNDGVRVEHPRQDNLFRWGGLHHDRRRKIDSSFTPPQVAHSFSQKRCFAEEAEFHRWAEESKLRLAEAQSLS
ncbi:MAG: hypothetical protein M3Q57_01800 [Pseudomonadota bacterium]|nr:hypothetical protein [Pseudomonadota bacterium]